MPRPRRCQELLLKGEAIWRDQNLAVREFPTDTRVCQRCLERREEVSRERLRVLAERIHRVSREEMFEGIDCMAGELWNELKQSNDMNDGEKQVASCARPAARGY